MTADILERLDFMLISRRSDEDAIIRDARAEIVRLRGEVEALRQCGVKYLGWLGVKDAENGLRKDMADPEMVDRPAPAMPNVVEGLVEALEMPDGYEVQEFLPGGWHYAWTRSDGERMASGTTWNHPALAAIAAWQAVYDRAADNRDAAGVVPAWIATWMADREILPDDDGDGISEGALVEALNNHERELLNAIPKAPAAVPAGEAVATEKNVHTEHCCREHGCKYGEAACPVELGQQVQSHPCEDCTPQPADGEAVAEWQVWHKEDGWGATHPDNVAEYRARGVPVRPLYAHPPAPVQAAQQEGGDSHAFKNFHRSLCARFGYTHDENDWRRDLVSLEEHIARMAAHPSACELGAVREVINRRKDEAEKRPGEDGYTMGWSDGVAGFARELEAALQHRGDSRGGEATP